METIKRYWWLFLLLPVVGYFLWVWYQSKNEAAESTKRAREAKEIKRVIREADQTPETDVRES